MADRRDQASLGAAIERIRKLHWEYEGRCANCITWCDCDSDIVDRHQHNVPWPCSTAKALADVPAAVTEVFGFWNYRNLWTPAATAELIPVSAKDAASMKGARDRLYHAYRTPWQPVEPKGGEPR